MKKPLIPTLIGLATALLLAGCALDLSFGGGKKDSTNTTSSNTTSNASTTNNNQHPAVGTQMVEPTVGQQLIDLKKARDDGAITETEYEAEKANLLNEKQ
jgi:hypothetical protein